MNLFHKFKSSVKKHSAKSALVINDRHYTYQQLYDKSMQIGHLLTENNSRRVGIFASKTLSAYSGLLGSMASGKTYVPLLDQFPKSRNLDIMDQTKVDTLVLDEGGLHQVEKMLPDLPPKIQLIFPELELKDIPSSVRHEFSILTRQDFEKSLEEVVEVAPDHFLHICFTSGSTGQPKGIPITHGNWCKSFIKHIEAYEFRSHYRYANNIELTFSSSMSETFVPWTIGAKVFVVIKNELTYQVNFLKKNKINFWIPGPSNANSLRRFGMLKKDSLPDLYCTIFGGEPLPKSIVLAWQKAAPNSTIINDFGSTECHWIANYKISKESKEMLTHNGIISVGNVLKGLDFSLIDDKGEKNANKGELCLTGANVFPGYLNKPKENAKRFFKFTGDSQVWFKTGDILKFEESHFFFLGRKDFMVKVRSQRVELEEINYVVKEITGAKTVYTVPHPIKDGVAQYLYLFIDKGGKMDKASIFKHLKKKLPLSMLPKAIFFIDDFHLTVNGKLDRNQLINKIKAFEP